MLRVNFHRSLDSHDTRDTTEDALPEVLGILPQVVGEGIELESVMAISSTYDIEEYSSYCRGSSKTKQRASPDLGLQRPDKSITVKLWPRCVPSTMQLFSFIVTDI